jgi:hypothetical protein
MRTRLLGAVLFLSGFICGAIATDHLHMRGSSQLATVLRTSIATESEFLASKAAREGRLAESLVHRVNAAAAADGTGFASIDQTFADLQETWFSPVGLWAARYRVERKYPNATPEGARRVHAHLWHNANLTLDELGLSAMPLANAHDTSDLCCDLAASSFHQLLERENTEVQRSIEEFYAVQPRP